LSLQPSSQGPTHDQYSAYRLPEIARPPQKRNCPDDYWERNSTHLSPGSAPPGSPNGRRDSKAVSASTDDRMSWPSVGNVSLPSLRGNSSRSYSSRSYSSRSYSEPERAPTRSSGSDYATASSPSNYHPPALFATEARADAYRHGQFRDRSPPPVYRGDGWPTTEGDSRRMSLTAQHGAAPPPTQPGHLPYRGGPIAHQPYQAAAQNRQESGRADVHAYVPATPVYEYPNSKSRKRSNLPKQSTEIMKRWFDEHIENPYPSEEQKKYFAAKANINLTQVCLSAIGEEF